MKQHAQVNIIHDKKQLHYMVEFHDAGIVDVTHGEYSYWSNAYEGIQFVRNQLLIDNFENNHIINVIRNLNTWAPETRVFSNLNIPKNIVQRQVTLYIPRYSMESFYDKDFGNDHEMKLSGLKYILTAYIYIAGVKVVLGSYMFDLGSARATHERVKYKADEYQLCIDFNIIDPISITYNDEWIQFRKNICGEPEWINNTGSVVHINLDPVIESETGGYYIRSGEFMGGIASIPFERNQAELFHADLRYDGNAFIQMVFNDVYEGDINMYLGETYGMWQKDDEGNIIRDEDGAPIPLTHWAIFELVMKDDENVWFCDTQFEDLETSTRYDETTTTFPFPKSEIGHDWSWYKPGLWLQGSVELYNVTWDVQDAIQNLPDEEKIEYLRTRVEESICLITNEIPLNKENYKFLVPSKLLDPTRNKINLNLVDMNEYEVSVVNKINKNIVNINRPEDYKANIIKPVFIRTEPLGNLTIHPAVTENISLNLNKYKSKVEVFYLRIEGIDFMEIGRTNQSVVFTIDGHLLPNEVEEGVAYLLDSNFNLITTGHYTYEQ